MFVEHLRSFLNFIVLQENFCAVVLFVDRFECISSCGEGGKTRTTNEST